jgi:outer membrane lipoprotein-sorting protein
MNIRIGRRRSFALAAALALAPAWALAQTPAPANDVYARMQKVNAGLKSYQAAFHVDVRLHSFLPLNPSLDGIAYYKQPDKNAIVFNTVPVLAQQFKKIYPQLEPPSEWPKLYDVSPAGDDGTTAQFRLVRKKNGRIDHVDVTVDDRTATVTSMTYVYKDGGSVSFQQTYRAIDGNYVLATQTGKVDLPQYKADVASTFSNYKLNVPIDDGVFAPE